MICDSDPKVQHDYIGCAYRKLKFGRSGDEVRLGWQVT
jgi:hypothetical protein